MKTARHIALAAAVAATTACPAGELFCELGGGDPYGEMPDLDMLVGDTVEASLLDHFNSNSDCLERKASYWWAARSTDSAAGVVSISRGHILTTVALEEADSVRVAVEFNLDGEGIDDDFGDAYRYGHVFLVRVRPHPESR